MTVTNVDFFFEKTLVGLQSIVDESKDIVLDLSLNMVLLLTFFLSETAVSLLTLAVLSYQLSKTTDI